MLPRTFQALRHRNFRLLTFGQLVSSVGTWMEQTALGWLVYQITGSELLLGTVAAAGATPLLLFSMWGGSLADRVPKRKILFVTQTALMVFAFTMALLVWSGHVQPWQIIFIAVLNGTANAFEAPTRGSFLIEITSREDLLNAISLNSSLFNMARVVGPALAGFAVVSLGVATCFFLNGLSFVAVIVALLMMRVPKRVAAEHTLGGWAHAWSGITYTWKHPQVRCLIIMFAVVVIFGWSYMVLMPAIAREVFGATAKGYGALASSIGFGAVFGSLFMASAGHRFAPRTLTFGGLWLFVMTLLLFSFTRNLPLGFALQAAAHFGMVVFLSATQSTLQTSITDEMQGRVMGVWALTVGASMPLGNLGAGWLAGWWGISHLIQLGAITCGTVGVIMFLIARRRDAAA